MMHNPPHPGRIVKRALVEGAGLTITRIAEELKVGRVTVSRLLNEHIGISPEMAIRLSLVLNTSSRMWLNMQNSYDLWQLRKTEARLYKQITRLHFQAPTDSPLKKAAH